MSICPRSSSLTALRAGAVVMFLTAGSGLVLAQATGPASPGQTPIQAAPAGPAAGTPAPEPDRKLEQIGQQQQHTTSGQGGKSEPAAELLADKQDQPVEHAPWTTYSRQTTPSTISADNFQLDHQRDLPGGRN